MTKRPARNCPCGTAAPYLDCCGPLHRGEHAAATAEQLMRSRYSAFVVGDASYLLRTWHSSTRPARLTLDSQRRWTRLEILDAQRGGMFDTAGTVTFRAHYEWQGKTASMHEQSRFGREDGAWAYLDDQRPYGR